MGTHSEGQGGPDKPGVLPYPSGVCVAHLCPAESRHHCRPLHVSSPDWSERDFCVSGYQSKDRAPLEDGGDGGCRCIGDGLCRALLCTHGRVGGFRHSEERMDEGEWYRTKRDFIIHINKQIIQKTMKTKALLGLMAFVCLAVLNFTQGANNFGLSQALASASSNSSSYSGPWDTSSSSTSHFITNDDPCCIKWLQTVWNSSPCIKGTRFEEKPLQCPLKPEVTTNFDNLEITTDEGYTFTIGPDGAQISVTEGGAIHINGSMTTEVTGYFFVTATNSICTESGGKCNDCQDFIADCDNYKQSPVPVE